MRTPRGFGRNYFSLAAIQAYSSGVRRHAVATAVQTHTRRCGPSTESESEAPPEEEITDLLLPEQPEPSSPCHCNRFYRRRTRDAARRVRQRQPLFCRCRKTRSGIAPPSSSFSLILPTLYHQGIR